MINNSLSIIPICSYSNIDTQKRQICKDNKGKAGIYRWINVVNNKDYIGSSINLSIRFRDYFSINSLKIFIKRNKSAIYSALLKYGYCSFKLEILEYCDISTVIEREQYYLDILKPGYNILKIAGSRLGTKQSEKTKKLISNASKLHRHSKETIERIRIANMGRKHSKKTIEYMRMVHLKRKHSEAHPLRVINNKTGEVKLFISIRQAAKFIDISYSSISVYLRKNKVYIRKGYSITRI